VPGISVLLPMYNAQTTLATALESLRRQRFSDWECVLCDDGSTDESAAIALAYAARDRRFTVIRCNHSGLVTTLNAGLRLCRAPYVARLDADDVCHRERLGAQYEYLEQHPELAGVGCGIRTFPRSGLSTSRRQYETWLNSLATEGDIARDRFVECPLAHPTWFIKREVFLAFGYRDMGWPEDYDLILRLLGAGQRLSIVQRRLLGWRESSTRFSRTNRGYDIESFTRCRAHFLAADWLANRPRYGLWGYGSTGRNLARALLLHGKKPAYIVELHPGRIGQRILGVPVVAPSGLASVRCPGDKLILSVAGLQQRSDARHFATAQGLVENEDFVCAA
jgi:glycosyltransferase involved in cell wall biosynthesis